MTQLCHRVIRYLTVQFLVCLRFIVDCFTSLPISVLVTRYIVVLQ